MTSMAMAAEQQYKRPESVLVIVCTSAGKVLLLRRAGSNFWQSVTGALNWGEDPASAAARELFEETGLSSKGLVDCKMHHRFVIYPMWRSRYAPGVVENKEYVFYLEIAEPEEITLDVDEHDEYVWLDKADALLRLSSHTNIEAARQLVPEV